MRAKPQNFSFESLNDERRMKYKVLQPDAADNAKPAANGPLANRCLQGATYLGEAIQQGRVTVGELLIG